MKSGAKFLLGFGVAFSLVAVAQLFPIQEGAVPFGDDQRNFTASQPDFQFDNTTKQMLVGITASAAFPAYSFPGVGNGDNGLYRSGTDEISLVTAGVNRLTIGPSGIISFGTANPQIAYLDGLTTALAHLLNGLTANVQTQINALGGGSGVFVRLIGDTMTGKLRSTDISTSTTHTSNALAVDGGISTARFLYSGGAGSGIPGSFRLRRDDGTLQWSIGMQGTAGATDMQIREAVSNAVILNVTTAGVITQVTGSAPWVKVSGDTMAGLTVTSLNGISSSVIAFLGGATANIQGQINNFVAGSGFVPITGGTMSGDLTIDHGGFSNLYTNTTIGNSSGFVLSLGTGRTFDTTGSKSSNLNSRELYIAGATVFSWANPALISISTSLSVAGNINLPALTASRAAIINGSNNIAISPTTSAELAFLSGATSSIVSILGGVTNNIASIANGGGAFVPLVGGTMSGDLIVNAQISGTATITAGTAINIAVGSGKYKIGGLSVIDVGTGYGARNLFVGSSGAEAVTAGVDNVAVGATAGDSLTTGNRNTVVGTQAGTALTTSSDSTMVGWNAGGSVTGAQNTLIGRSAADGLTTGIENTVVGYAALDANGVVGSRNTVVGSSAATAVTAGSSNNVFIGRSAAVGITTAQNMVLIGVSATSSNTTINSIAIGSEAVVTASSAVQLFKGTNSTANSIQFDGVNFLNNTGAASFSSAAMTGTNAAVIQAVVRGAAAQSASLQEWQNSSASVLAKISSTGEIVSNSAGLGLSIKEGANARMGNAQMVGGAVSVPTTAITVGDRVFLSVATASGVQGFVSLSGVTSGTGFGIVSSNVADTSNVNWIIVKPSP